jgi:hypothetical protein
MQSEEQSSFVLTTQLVLPDSHDFPVLRPEQAVYFPIAGAVVLDLPPPKRRTGSRPGGVLRAAMPEAAVDEDGDVKPRENKIGFHPASAPWFGFLILVPCSLGLERKRLSSPPARDAIRSENLNQPQFGALVA